MSLKTPIPTTRLGAARSIAAVALSLTSVASLLAWVFGLGRFSVWFWGLSAPGMVALAALGWSVARRDPGSRLHTALVVGTIGGLIGTAGYDLFRLPFLLLGYRLLAPIDSYGVLLLGADGSSALTGFAGWMFHVANGVTFGIAFAVVALGRRWWWGIVWAMTLETATIVTPFADSYALRGRWNLIAIAYAAHLFYGAPLGRWVEQAELRVGWAREVTRRPAAAALLAVTVGMLVWHQPWSTDPDDRAGSAVASGPSAVVRDGRFAPMWLHVPVNGCAMLRNDDAVSYELTGVSDVVVTVGAGTTTRVCFPDEGVHRVRTSSTPGAGGFVIVDPELT